MLGGDLPIVEDLDLHFQDNSDSDQPVPENEDSGSDKPATSGAPAPTEVLDDIIPEPPLDPFENEFSLWSTHQKCFSASDVDATTSAPSMDVGDHENLHKDVGGTPIQDLKYLPMSLQSSEQTTLRQMAEVVGFQPVTEHKLQFAPRWIIDKAIHKERQNYVNQQAFVSVSIT